MCQTNESINAAKPIQICCNQNCREGRECPNRQEKSLSEVVTETKVFAQQVIHVLKSSITRRLNG